MRAVDTEAFADAARVRADQTLDLAVTAAVQTLSQDKADGMVLAVLAYRENFEEPLAQGGTVKNRLPTARHRGASTPRSRYPMGRSSRRGGTRAPGQAQPQDVPNRPRR